MTDVYTDRISYAGAGRLDVTSKSGGLDGLPFAPSWRILWPVPKLRREAGASAAIGAWPKYVADYTAEIRTSDRDQRPAWDRLLARDVVTLCCYCTDPAMCHRTVLAEILGKLGATLEGERHA